MWIVARLLIAVGAVLYKLHFRRTPKEFPRLHAGMPYHVREVRDKSRVVKRYVEAPLESAFVCCLSKETWLDRFWKTLGFGEELQTGDAEFDRRIYVIADHPLARNYLLRSPELRDTVMKLIPAKVRSVSITGLTIRLELPSSVDPSEVLDSMSSIRSGVLSVQGNVVSRFVDPFYKTALVAESFVWGVAGYAAMGVLNFGWERSDVHLQPLDILPHAVTAGIGVALLWMAALGILLGASSRTPRIVTESGLILGLAIFVASPQVISDMNRVGDSSEGWSLVRYVQHKKIVEKRGSKGQRTYTYHIYISPDEVDTSLPFELPESIAVDRSVYYEIREGAYVSIEIGRGALGLPWYRSIGPARSAA